MFTGIVTAVGTVREVIANEAGDARFTIAPPSVGGWNCADIPVGASIACSGVCLTVVEATDAVFAVDASLETMSATTAGSWKQGTPVNLERALAMGDELGGHMVSGHVDGLGEVDSVDRDGEGHRIGVEAPPDIAALIAPKGSIAIDGVSLTVNEVDGRRFRVMVIPHTWRQTTLRDLGPGHKINLEADMLARYVARVTSPIANASGG